MTKTTFLAIIILWALSTFNIDARSLESAPDARTAIKEKPQRAAGVYYAYPGAADNYGSEAPKGYKPFYISHYGRHGSRYLISDNDYRRVMDVLERADKAGALTDKGKQLRCRLDTIWEEAYGRGGELSPLGYRQHRAIATRMGKAYPQVFAPNAQMSAVSTVIMRCAHSMFAFTDALKSLYPQLRIPMESSERHMNYMNYHSPESAPYSSHKGPYYQDYKRFRAKNTNPDRLTGIIFSDSAYVNRWVDKEDFMWDLYWVAADLQNMETDIELLTLFSTEELYDLWQTSNFNFFARNSSYAPADGMFTANAANLLNNIIEGADKAIAGGTHGATLRFGHDGNIIPLAALMKLENCYSDIVEPGDLASEYADFDVCPMGANLQLVFFRNDKNPDDILVRIYLNEHDRAIDGLTPAMPGYYRWNELRPFLFKLANP